MDNKKTKSGIYLGGAAIRQDIFLGKIRYQTLLNVQYSILPEQLTL